MPEAGGLCDRSGTKRQMGTSQNSRSIAFILESLFQDGRDSTAKKLPERELPRSKSATGEETRAVRPSI